MVSPFSFGLHFYLAIFLPLPDLRWYYTLQGREGGAGVPVEALIVSVCFRTLVKLRESICQWGQHYCLPVLLNPENDSSFVRARHCWLLFNNAKLNATNNLVVLGDLRKNKSSVIPSQTPSNCSILRTCVVNQHFEQTEQIDFNSSLAQRPKHMISWISWICRLSSSLGLANCTNILSSFLVNVAPWSAFQLPCLVGPWFARPEIQTIDLAGANGTAHQASELNLCMCKQLKHAQTECAASAQTSQYLANKYQWNINKMILPASSQCSM